MDLWVELGGPRLPWGRLARFVNQLPPEAALWRSMDPESAEWSTQTHLLANASDMLAALVWQGGGGKGRRPKPVPRPGDKPKSIKWGNAKGLDPAAVRARLDAKKPRR